MKAKYPKTKATPRLCGSAQYEPALRSAQESLHSECGHFLSGNFSYLTLIFPFNKKFPCGSYFLKPKKNETLNGR